MPDPESLEELIKTKNIPGASVSIMSDNIISESNHAGVIDVTNPKPVTKNTIFEVASLSKPVFAYIVLKQVEKGLFSRPGEDNKSGLDRPLHEICDFGPPGMRNDPNYKRLTVRMLLSHQAGLPNEFGSAGQKYVASANTRFDYSGEAYCFLNEVLEHVTKKNLHKLAQEVFSSLGMNDSRFLPDSSNSAHKIEVRAIGHDVNSEKDESNHFPPQYPPHPAASLVSTAEDYLKFLQKLTQDEFIKEHMFANPVPLKGNDKKAIDAGVQPLTLDCLSWGIGIGIQKTKDGTIAFHWGDINTNRSFFAINLDTNKAVVCLTNSANGPLIFKQITNTVGDLSPALTWLKIRENLPVELNETKKSENFSKISKSIFSRFREPSTQNHKNQNEQISVLRKKGG